MPLAISVVLLVAVLVFAVVRPRGLAEGVFAVPAASVAVASGSVPWDAARGELVALAPVVGFLAAVLALAYAAGEWGVFSYLGSIATRLSGASPSRLLLAVVVVASGVTATLTLDATVTLLTPVILATTLRMHLRPHPHLYACTHLANSASLLLPISNLTNLLAFTSSGLSFGTFAALMALPWVCVIVVEYAVLSRFFRGDLRFPGRAAPQGDTAPPWFALVTLGTTLAAMALSEPLGVHPGWAAAAGAVALAVPWVGRQPAQWGHILAATNPGFCTFVLALGVVVLGVRRNGLGAYLAAITPTTTTLAGLLAAAALAAVLANLLNNLPATLLLLPSVAFSPGLVLAVLIGVNLGPNLTYTGSLATLLWRRVLHAHDTRPSIAEFTRLGLVSVPLTLLAGVIALWAALSVTGL